MFFKDWRISYVYTVLLATCSDIDAFCSKGGIRPPPSSCSSLPVGGTVVLSALLNNNKDGENKIPKFSEASASWPDDVYTWAKSPSDMDYWSSVPERVTKEKTVTVHNEKLLWERILAHTDGGSVFPASAYLAPIGGRGNLCNESERYTDYCTFTVQGPAHYLYIQTEEEEQYKYRIAGEAMKE